MTYILIVWQLGSGMRSSPPFFTARIKYLPGLPLIASARD